MTLKNTTPVPNALLDIHLPSLSESELKVLLVVVRQTCGWVDRRTGGRKERDRISGSQFRQKTGLSRRIISLTLKKLCAKDLIVISDPKGNVLKESMERKGRSYLFYSVAQPAHIEASTCAQRSPEVAHNCYHNKRNIKKESRTKANGFTGHIGLVLEARMTMQAAEKNAS